MYQKVRRHLPNSQNHAIWRVTLITYTNTHIELQHVHRHKTLNILYKKPVKFCHMYNDAYFNMFKALTTGKVLTYQQLQRKSYFSSFLSSVTKPHIATELSFENDSLNSLR